MAKKSTKKSDSNKKSYSKSSSKKSTSKKAAKKSTSKTSKKSIKKSSSKKNTSKKSSFLRNNVWSIVAIALFVASLLALGITGIGDASVTGNQIFGGDEGSSQDQNTVSVGGQEFPFNPTGMDITKLIFYVIVILAIFTILNMTGIPEYKSLQWVFSILVGFLAVGYIAPAEIFAVLSTYSALGLTIMSIIPFVVMVLFSAAILSPYKRIEDLGAEGQETKKWVAAPGRVTVGKVVLVQMAWAFYTLFLAYKVIYSIYLMVVEGGRQFEGVTVGVIILAVTLFFGIAITFKNTKFRKWVTGIGKSLKSMQEEIEGQEEEAEIDKEQRKKEAKYRRRHSVDEGMGWSPDDKNK